MKKLLKLSLVLLITIFMVGSVYAASGCNISVSTAKNEYSKNEEFTVDVNISNIQSERGIISLGATLEYDKSSLTLVSMEGKNGWETPSNGSSFNSSNGKIAITRGGLGKNNETVFTIKFKVQNQSKPNVRITLKDITVGDGIKPAKINTTYKDITIKEANQQSKPNNNQNTAQTPNTNGGTTGNKGDTTQNGSSNTNKGTSNPSKTTGKTLTASKKESVKNGVLPKAGNSSIIIFSLIGICTLIAVVLFIKIRKNK